MKIEVCADALETALIADQFGVDQIELCSALSVGGLTPNYALIEACATQTNLKVNVMIRHQEGNFVYNNQAIDVMLQDIKQVKLAGGNGVVFGCLTSENTIDIDQNKILLKQAKHLGLSVVFHRAFDFLIEPFEGLETLINMGFDAVLTSGQAPTAYEGITIIKQLVELSKGRISILAGSGVNASNASDISKTGVDVLHFTAHQTVNESTALGMGNRTVPNTDKIKSILNSL